MGLPFLMDGWKQSLFSCHFEFSSVIMNMMISKQQPKTNSSLIVLAVKNLNTENSCCYCWKKWHRQNGVSFPWTGVFSHEDSLLWVSMIKSINEKCKVCSEQFIAGKTWKKPRVDSTFCFIRISHIHFLFPFRLIISLKVIRTCGSNNLDNRQ